jgi:hypothetical protein
MIRYGHGRTRALTTRSSLLHTAATPLGSLTRRMLHLSTWKSVQTTGDTSGIPAQELWRPCDRNHAGGRHDPNMPRVRIDRGGIVAAVKRVCSAMYLPRASWLRRSKNIGCEATMAVAQRGGRPGTRSMRSKFSRVPRGLQRVLPTKQSVLQGLCSREEKLLRACFGALPLIASEVMLARALALYS